MTLMYESGISTYLPTSAMRTLGFGAAMRAHRSFHSVRSGGVRVEVEQLHDVIAEPRVLEHQRHVVDGASRPAR